MNGIIPEGVAPRLGTSQTSGAVRFFQTGLPCKRNGLPLSSRPEFMDLVCCWEEHFSGKQQKSDSILSGSGCPLTNFKFVS